MKTPEELVIFGAGSIGRGFLAQIFGRSGWRVTFVDVNERLVDALNAAGRYRVNLISPDGTVEDVEVPDVRAVHARDARAVAAAFGTTRYVGTAVGAAVLPAVARQLTEILAAAELAKCDILLAENIHDPGATFIEHLRTGTGRDADSPSVGAPSLDGPVSADRAALPGVHLCAVGKMVPESHNGSGSLDVATEAMNILLVDGTDWRNPFPQVSWLEPVEPIEAYVDRKLYIHNLMHAAMAFLSVRHCPHCRYIAELTREKSLMRVVVRLIEDMSRALAAEYPSVFTRRDLLSHGEDLVYRFSNRRLGDTVKRVGRDVRRKLGSGERVMGALLLLHRHGFPVQRVLDVYEAALAFGVADGQLSVEDVTGGPSRDLVARFSGPDIPPPLLDALAARVDRLRTTGGALGT